jgi:prepilin-type N-terminal cleavage/methylation domain-containing protein/prepilin-type processing-associated H-X9-DG protein
VLNIVEGKMKKFTLLELLIVVAIIGILVSLLMPSLQNARNKAKDAVCISNVKQLGIAVNIYAVGDDGRLPSHKKNGSTSWAEFIDIQSTELFLCPRTDKWTYTNGNEHVPDVSTKWNRTHRQCYGYNGFWLGLSPYSTGFQSQPMSRNTTYLGDCASPTEVIMISDSSPMNNGYWASTLWYKWRQRAEGANNEGVKAAHGNKSKMTNIVFVDGHAAPHNAHNVNFNDSEYKDWWNPNPGQYPISF